MFSQPLSIFRFISSHRPLNILNSTLRPVCFRVEPPAPGRQGTKDNFNVDQNVTCMKHGIVVEARTFPCLTTFLKGSSFSTLQSLQFFSLQYLQGLFFSVFVFSTPVRTQHMKPNFCQGVTKVRSKKLR